MDEIDGASTPFGFAVVPALHSDGGFHNIFLETGSAMTSSGGIDTIWVKNGASFFMDGGIHVISMRMNPTFISMAAFRIRSPVLRWLSITLMHHLMVAV